MENYKLKPEEVVLYKGDVILSGKKGTTELIFTNINMVFVNRYKNYFQRKRLQFLNIL